MKSILTERNKKFNSNTKTCQTTLLGERIKEMKQKMEPTLEKIDDDEEKYTIKDHEKIMNNMVE